MAFGDIVTSVCLLALGGVIVGAGLWHLDRQDRRRVEATRQNGCRWHHWQALEGGIWLVCRLCAKRSRRLNPHGKGGRETLPSENIFWS